MCIPCAVVHAGRDLDVFPQTHSQAIFRALGSSDKQFFDFPTRLHYFEPEGDEDENQGAQLTHWLERLGFSKAGQHRSKNVSLLRQGDINLILNAEPYSFAATRVSPA